MVYHYLITGDLLFPSPPSPPVVPAALKIKKMNVKLHQNGRNFVHNCLNLAYPTVDKVIQAVSGIPNQ